MKMKAIFIVCLLPFLAACSGSLDKPKRLNDEDAAKITGKMIVKSQVRPSIQIYNGTEWRITDVDVVIANNKANTSRRFRFSCSEIEMKRSDKGLVTEQKEKRSFVPPLSEGPLDGSIGDFLDNVQAEGDWAWSIESVYGFK